MNFRQAVLAVNAVFITSLFLGGCGPTAKEEKVSSESPASLIGTWKLKERIDHDNQKTEWETVSDSIVYDKYLTDTHFTWINYDKNNDILVGIGGGTYTYDGTNYIENIEFFRPPTSSILGQQINFTAEFKEGRWYHTGYSKNTEFDPELAQTVVVDSSKIEEIWEKVSGEIEGAQMIQGTWELLTYKDNAEGLDLSYPDFVNYIKLLTPTHFIWIQYNDEGDEISGAGAGTYSYQDEKYTESIQVLYPTGNPLRGSDVTFTCVVDGSRWTHKSTEGEGGQASPLFVDEKWAKIGSL